METAKKNLVVIETAAKTGDLQKTRFKAPLDKDLQVSQTEKTGIYEVSRRSSPDKEAQVGKPVHKSKLVNKINYINFQDGTLLVHLKHRTYNNTLTLIARPQPCPGDLLDCLWSESEEILQILKFYEFKNILIPDGQTSIIVEPELVRMDEEAVSVLLPEYGYEISSRTVARHSCKGISAQFIQNSSIFPGALLDFNACSFKIGLKVKSPQNFEWINPKSPVNLILSDKNETYYSGECRIIRHSQGQEKRSYILKPLVYEIQRFRNKEFRSNRYQLTPSPNVLFLHPFTKKMFHLKIIDLSGSGFSVEEDENNSVLLPGMVLPELELIFANGFTIKCRAQVVYRKIVETEKRKNWVKCGMAFLDINIQDHVTLTSMLNQTKDSKSYLCNRVNLEELWDFFFETGFIYPDKYEHVQKNKQKIKVTYEKLYHQTPHIARHFVYQDKGRIMGHMAMLRFFKKTWLIHHHAARKSALNKAGLVVLDQIGRMINNSHRIDSLNMDYMICYYRPENKFPNRIFGGVANSIGDLKGCSIDTFAYFRHLSDFSCQNLLPVPWRLSSISKFDFLELEHFYNHQSGGLMLDATDLGPNRHNLDQLSEEYRRVGFKRDRQLFALKRDDELKAVITVNLSDLGLNLSDLTNCINIVVIDTKALDIEILNTALTELASKFQKPELPALLYPVSYADEQGLLYDKRYNLWAFNLQFLDPWFKYINRLLRFI